jgi:O-antigen/teichoic acid export membrane protein
MTTNESVSPPSRLRLLVGAALDLTLRWKSRAGAWAFVGLLFSISFTVFNLLLVLLMPLADFGLFSYGQSLVLFVGVLVGTLILEPTSTVGTKYPDHEQLRYLTFALAGVVVVGLLSALPLAVLFRLAHWDAGWTPLLTAALVAPLAQAFHVGRRYLYMRERFAFLVTLSVLHAVLLLLALAIFYLTRAASPTAALAATGVAGAAPTLLLAIRLRLWRHIPGREDFRRYARDHWGYSRWTLASAAPHWFSTSGMIPVAVWLFSLEIGSIYRICQLVASPVVQISQLLSQTFLPFVSQRAHVSAKSYLASVQRKAFWLYLAIAIASTALTLAVIPFVIDHLVPPGLRTQSLLILLILLAGNFFDVLRGVQIITVSAAGRTEYLFWSTMLGMLVMYALALPLVYLAGVVRIARYASVRILAARWLARAD